MAANVSVSPLGATTGAFLGAVARPLVVYLFIRTQLQPGDAVLSILAVSAMIGLCVGGLGGLIGKPLISAIVGGALAVAAYYLTFIPLAFCLCLSGLEQGQGGAGPPPWWAMMLTGAIPAAIGAAAELLIGRKTSPSAPDDVPATQPPPERSGGSQGPWIS